MLGLSGRTYLGTGGSGRRRLHLIGRFRPDLGFGLVRLHPEEILGLVLTFVLLLLLLLFALLLEKKQTKKIDRVDAAVSRSPIRPRFTGS